MGKSATKGRYICKVGFYDIYAKDTTRSVKNSDKREVASTDYVIYHSRKLVVNGFKTKDSAIEKVKSLLGEKTVNYGL
jgi:hypothetical protein